MALIASSFAHRYAELTAREPTFAERLLDVQRREVCARKEIETQVQAAFQDVLHVASIMIADRSAARERIAASAHQKTDERSVALQNQQTAVWFPAAPPRQVRQPNGRPLRAFPHAAFREICDEERELRTWLYGVERRLRQHIVEAHDRSRFFLSVLDDTILKEDSARQRLRKEEDDAFTSFKQHFFRTVPVDYYRHLVIQRYGVTAIENSVMSETELLHGHHTTVDDLEGNARAALMVEEDRARGAVFEYLQHAYNVQQFVLNHQEVLRRYEIEQAETNAVYPLISGLCRANFGPMFCHTPAVALHLCPSSTCLRALCLVQARTLLFAAAAPSTPAPAVHLDEPASSPADVAPVEKTKLATEAADLAPRAVAQKTETTAQAVAPAQASLHAPETGLPTLRSTETALPRLPTFESVLPALRAAQEQLPTLKTTYTQLPTLRVTVTILPTLYAQETEEKSAVSAVTATSPANADSPKSQNSVLTCTPQLPLPVFSSVQIFVGDPFAESPVKHKKGKKSKKKDKKKPHVSKSKEPKS